MIGSIRKPSLKFLRALKRSNTPGQFKLVEVDLADSLQVQLKTFIANVTTQVIERHIVRGLELIFSPMVVADMSDEELRGLASEPASVIRQRRFLKDRIAKLESGRKVLRKVMRKGAM